MSSVERGARVEKWAGEERRRIESRAARRAGLNFGMVSFALLLVLAELAWLAFLGYLASRALL